MSESKKKQQQSTGLTYSIDTYKPRPLPFAQQDALLQSKLEAAEAATQATTDAQRQQNLRQEENQFVTKDGVSYQTGGGVASGSRPIVVDRWTTESRRAYPHPILKQEAIIEVDEDGENGNKTKPSGVSVAAGGGEEITKDRANAQSKLVEAATVTRSSGCQTRPPFCNYTVETKNQLPPRTMSPEQQLNEIQEAHRARSASAGSRTAKSPKPEETTSREVGSGRDNHVISKHVDASSNTREENSQLVARGRSANPTRTRSSSAGGSGGKRNHSTSSNGVIGSGNNRKGSSSAGLSSYRTVTRRTFADSSTQTAEDPLKITMAAAGIHGRTLFTTNLFLCPACHAVMRSNATNPECTRCGDGQQLLALLTSKQVNAPGHQPIKGIVLAEAPQSNANSRHPTPTSRPPSAPRSRRSSPSPAATRSSSAKECMHWFD